MGIVVKGMTVPALLVKLDKNLSVDENISEIKEKLSSDFFKGSLTVIDFESADVSDENRKKIEDAVRDSQTQFLGYKPSLKLDKELKNAPPLTGQESRTVKVINKNLRSGQKVEHDGDVLIIGDVNPGSYVTAWGNIIVMGTLSGIVHAGAGGDDSAVTQLIIRRMETIFVSGLLMIGVLVLESNWKDGAKGSSGFFPSTLYS